MSENRKKKKNNFISKSKLSILKKDFVMFFNEKTQSIDDIFVSDIDWKRMIAEDYSIHNWEKMVKELKVRITKKKFFHTVLEIAQGLDLNVARNPKPSNVSANNEDLEVKQIIEKRNSNCEVETESLVENSQKQSFFKTVISYFMTLIKK